MTDREKRPIPPNPVIPGKRSTTLAWPVMRTIKYVQQVEAYVTKLETELCDMTIDRDLWQSDHNEDCPNAASLESMKSLHASIIEQGRLVQIGAGAMSAGEYIEWALGKLEGK